MLKTVSKLHITSGLGEVRIIAFRPARVIFFVKINVHRFYIISLQRRYKMTKAD